MAQNLKPINVDAQRIQKVLQETHGKSIKLHSRHPLTSYFLILGHLEVLNLLSNEVFEGIQSRPDEDISK